VEKVSRRQIEEAKRERKARIWEVSQWVILILCIVIMAIQAPKIIAALTNGDRPRRDGTVRTDRLTDQCIHNLWKISKHLQIEQNPPKDMTCPAGKMPYAITIVEDHFVARCPDPGKHGFVEIRVSNKNPVPEAKK